VFVINSASESVVSVLSGSYQRQQHTSYGGRISSVGSGRRIDAQPVSITEYNITECSGAGLRENDGPNYKRAKVIDMKLNTRR
jgi:hypothetical protein